MNLTGKIALLRLSPLGMEVLGAVVANQVALEGLIVSANGLGLWIEHEPREGLVKSPLMRVLLVKWEYLATVEIEFSAEAPPPRSVIGFKPS